MSKDKTPTNLKDWSDHIESCIVRDLDFKDDFKISIDLIESWVELIKISGNRAENLRRVSQEVSDSLEDVAGGNISLSSFWDLRSKLDHSLYIYNGEY